MDRSQIVITQNGSLPGRGNVYEFTYNKKFLSYICADNHAEAWRKFDALFGWTGKTPETEKVTQLPKQLACLNIFDY